MGSVLRSLALASGLVFALPPGWCCLLARPLAPPASRAATAPCECCGEQGEEDIAPSTDHPAPPAAPRDAKCPCPERDSAPPAPVFAAGSLALAPPAGLEPLAAGGDVVAVAASADPAPASPSPQLLHHVWLC